MTFPLAARFAHPDYGWDGDQKLAAEHLTAGQVYLVSELQVGRSSSYLVLWNFPGIRFNTVMFEGADWPDADEGDPSPDTHITSKDVTP